jgi:hypothetical protein
MSETAMVLTEQEWQDLSAMVKHALVCCTGPCCEHRKNLPEAERMRMLARRIVVAVES